MARASSRVPLPILYQAARWKTLSTPVMGRRIDSFSVMSPLWSATFSAARLAALAGSRTRATTLWPAWASCAATWPPMNPVAPVKKYLIPWLLSLLPEQGNKRNKDRASQAPSTWHSAWGTWLLRQARRVEELDERPVQGYLIAKKRLLADSAPQHVGC